MALVTRVSVNGNIWETTESEFSVTLEDGSSNIAVTTEKDCQGIFEKQITLNEKILVYPNPVKNNLYINVGRNSSEPALIQMHDIGGKLILSRTLGATYGLISLDVAFVPSGIYTIRLTDRQGTHNFKIIKK